MCVFSSHLANICTWVGMADVPYWLPAVTQEDGKMEDREGVSGGDKGGGGDVRTPAPRLSPVSCFSFVSLMITKKHGSLKAERSTSERKRRKQ